MGVFIGLLIALAVITVVGHGLWCLLAFIARGLLGGGVPETNRTSALNREEGGPRSSALRDLNATERQLNSLVEQGLLDTATGDRLQRVIYQRRRALTGVGWTAEYEQTAPTPARKEVDVPPVSIETQRELVQPVLPEIVDAALVEDGDAKASVASPPAEVRKAAAPPTVPAPQSRQPERTSRRAASPVSPTAVPARTNVPPATPGAKPLTQPVMRSRPPAAAETPKASPPAAERRESWSRLLATFMEDRNIRWGELVGGLLIVGCSIALVISLREQLEGIPYFQFFMFSGVTAALFGAGLYTAHRWKLESTSRTVLLIATLLVPLNFLSMTWLSPAGGVLYTLATGGVALLLFAWMVRLSERLIVPSGGYLAVLGVIGNAAVLLVLSKLIDPETRLEAALAWGCLPAACHVLSLGVFLRKLVAQPKLEEGHVRELFVLLGVVTFATLATLSVLGFRTPPTAAVLQPLAPLVSVICIPVVAAGLLVVRRLTNQPALAGARTAGTGIAISGLFLMAAALGLAWPQPGVLILVAVLNWTAMSVLAVRANLPAIHTVALACVTLGYLTGFHWLWGNLDFSSDAALRQALTRALLSIQSGTSLTVLVIVIVAASELMVRRWREHAVWYAGAAVALGLVSVSLATVEGLYRPGAEIVARTTIVYLIYAVISLLANVRWKKAQVTYVGLGLAIGATFWALRWWRGSFSPEWPAFLGIELLAMSVLAVWCKRSVVGEPSPASGNAGRQGWLQRAYGEPLAITSEVAGWVAVVLGCWSGWRLRETLPWSPWHVVTAASLAVSHLILLALRRQPFFAQTGGWFVAGTGVAIAGWLATVMRHVEPALSIAFGLVVVSTFQSAIALAAGWFADRSRALNHSGARTGGSLWFAPLADQWLHVSLGCVAAAVVLTLFAGTWNLSNLPHFQRGWRQSRACSPPWVIAGPS